MSLSVTIDRGILVEWAKGRESRKEVGALEELAALGETPAVTSGEVTSGVRSRSGRWIVRNSRSRSRLCPEEARNAWNNVEEFAVEERCCCRRVESDEEEEEETRRRRGDEEMRRRRRDGREMEEGATESETKRKESVEGGKESGWRDVGQGRN